MLSNDFDFLLGKTAPQNYDGIVEETSAAIKETKQQHVQAQTERDKFHELLKKAKPYNIRREV